MHEEAAYLATKLAKNIFSVVRDNQERVPGMQALSRSVIAKAAIKHPVELFKRGFLYNEMRSRELPRIPSSTRAEVDDSTTTSPTLRGGKAAILAALLKNSGFPCLVLSGVDFYRLFTLNNVRNSKDEKRKASDVFNSQARSFMKL